MKKAKPVSIDWRAVFHLRCKSKRGFPLTQEEGEYCKAAWESDKKRYAAMGKDVFEATKPFGAY